MDERDRVDRANRVLLCVFALDKDRNGMLLRMYISMSARRQGNSLFEREQWVRDIGFVCSPDQTSCFPLFLSVFFGKKRKWKLVIVSAAY